MKPIKIPSAPLKICAALTYHQVGSCTLLHARWDRTTEFCNSLSFAIPDPGPTGTVLDINWCFARLLLKVDRSNNETTGSTFPRINPLKMFKGFPYWAIFVFFDQMDQVATKLAGVWQDFFCSLLRSFDFVIVFSSNTISIIRIVEYSTISVIEYFEDTLDNMGLPEA